jgi:hypothetical protein
LDAAASALTTADVFFDDGFLARPGGLSLNLRTK